MKFTAVDGDGNITGAGDLMVRGQELFRQPSCDSEGLFLVSLIA
jgi:hypothetical protein